MANCEGNVTIPPTIATVARRDTHRHRGDGRWPSGNRKSRCVPISPKGISQKFSIHAHLSVGVTSGGRTPRLQIAPITSMSHPAGLRGRRTATTSPTIENAAAGARSASWAPAVANEKRPSAKAR